MAISKPTFLNRLKLVVRTQLHHLSSVAKEDAPKRRRSNTKSQPCPTPTPSANPNHRNIHEHFSVLTGKRLELHNRILKLIQENDLGEAVLLTRHSVYSNCKPTIFTCNHVMAACLCQSKYTDLRNLHSFITQSAIAPNIVTYNLMISTYMDCGETNTAMGFYKQLINEAPFDPNTKTYRIIVKGLVDNDKLEQALEIKDYMLSKGFEADPIVYSHLMAGQAKNDNPDEVFNLYEELKEKVGGNVYDGVVYGSMMKGYFLKGMGKKAMECYEEALGEESQIIMSATAYTSILEALSKNGKFNDAHILFDKMLADHNPPKLLTVNLASYNVMVNGFCAENRFVEAINIFNKMGEKCYLPDTRSFNNLIEQLCKNGMLAKAEELYKSMKEKKASPDQDTFVNLKETCFKEDRADDAAMYYKTMIESKLRPNLKVYNRLMDGLVKVGKVDEAKCFFDMMAPKLEMDCDSYKFIMKSLFDCMKHNEVLEIIGALLRENPSDFSDKLEVFTREELKKVDREDDLVKLIADVKREKFEAKAKAVEEVESAEARVKGAYSSFLSNLTV
ncbi:hypothetical protein OROMI_011933 [Orobanche minor]